MMTNDVQRESVPSSREGRGLRQSLTMDADDSGEYADEGDSLISPITEFATQNVRRLSISMDASLSTVDDEIERNEVRPAGGEHFCLLILCCFACFDP